MSTQNQLATTPPQSPSPWSMIDADMIKELDVEKLERLYALQERHVASEAERQLATALTNFQAECPTIKKERKNTHLNTAYAKIDDIMAAIQPMLSKHGLSVSFDTPSTKESLTAICYVMHSAGAKFSRQVTVPVDTGMRGANITQQLGSASSYAQRYALIAALNLNVTDRQDDDGATSGSGKITEEQANEIYQLMEPLPPERRKGVLEWIKADSVEHIMSKDFEKVVKNLKRATS